MTDHDEQQREIDRLGRELVYEHKRRAQVRHLCSRRSAPELVDENPDREIGRLCELLRLIEEAVK